MFKTIEYSGDLVEFVDLVNIDNDFPGGHISKQKMFERYPSNIACKFLWEMWPIKKLFFTLFFS